MGSRTNTVKNYQLTKPFVKDYETPLSPIFKFVGNRGLNSSYNNRKYSIGMKFSHSLSEVLN